MDDPFFVPGPGGHQIEHRDQDPQQAKTVEGRSRVDAHGSRLPRVLGTAKTLADLGAHFGDTLYAAEVDYLVAHEWAKSAEDVPWRRTKCGLHMTPLQRDAAAAYLQQRHGRA